MDVLTLLATVTLHWTNPTQLARLDDCSDSTAVCHLTSVNVYWAQVGGDGRQSLLRSHAAQAGAGDTIQVPDVPAATYWVIPVSAAGESYCPPRGYTVGVPSVSVPPWWPAEKEPQFDIQGRRVEPGASGLYFTRHRKRVVLR